MFALPPQTFRWSDPHSWPWVFYVWIVMIGAGYIPKLWRIWRQQSAKSWLPVSATIDSTHVDAAPNRFLQMGRRSAQFQANLNYSFSVGGTTYTGQYSRMFHTEAEALEFIRDLWGKTLTAQVNPAKPTKSLVFDSEIQNLIRVRPSRTFEQMNCQNPDELTRLWFTPFLQLFVILAAAGFLLSVWVHVGAILGHAVAPSTFFAAFHVGIFVVFFPAVLAATKIAGTSRRSDFWKIALRFGPPWMLYGVYVLFPYTIFNFFTGAFAAGAPRHGHGDPGVMEWRLFSGHWMLFYFCSLALLYSAIRSRTATGFCHNGHRFSSQYSKCPQCGDPTHYAPAKEDFSHS
jgi:hypothetical protein